MARKAKTPKNSKAAMLLDVTGITITEMFESFEVAWQPVVGATKYSVRLECQYDEDGDGLPDGEDEVERELSSTTTTASFAKRDLQLEAEAGPPLAPVRIEADVKPMAPGKAGGKRKGTWSGVPAVWQPKPPVA